MHCRIYIKQQCWLHHVIHNTGSLQSLRLLPVHLPLPVMTTSYDQAGCISQIRVNVCQWSTQPTHKTKIYLISKTDFIRPIALCPHYTSRVWPISPTVESWVFRFQRKHQCDQAHWNWVFNYKLLHPTTTSITCPVVSAVGFLHKHWILIGEGGWPRNRIAARCIPWCNKKLPKS